MRSDDVLALKELLEGRRVLSLSVLLDGLPYCGLLPFVARADYGALIVHASDLARHTRGLGEGAPVAMLVHAEDTPSSSALELPRLSAQGLVARVPDVGEGYDSARARYQGRFPESAVTFGLGDFHLYELRIERARLVAGFARTVNLTPSRLAEIALL